ncbi:hypothetical protein P168DRAFT_107499 [Aspergillus campestris IBT 28561]|uniref:Uncharacterized protein n=1 Tax=Aspergillus campestris (strain IBT 28561) TaxID=1392248 RepID=A0A2I1D8R4_ASPC2|nr:uncharacterized protein P168DRAFT_107499 [Aspergillus campestris IBT 28561]PKY06271.1 hypothetical protein P168DRAFT_107499 [Aspergillus campestris IBT 28561]
MEVKPAKSPTFSLHSPLLFSLSLSLSLSLSSFFSFFFPFSPSTHSRSVSSPSTRSLVYPLFFLRHFSSPILNSLPHPPFLPQPGAASASSPCLSYLSYISARGPFVIVDAIQELSPCLKLIITLYDPPFILHRVCLRLLHPRCLVLDVVPARLQPRHLTPPPLSLSQARSFSSRQSYPLSTHPDLWVSLDFIVTTLALARG